MYFVTMGFSLIFMLILFFCIGSSNQGGPVANTPLGTILGLWKTSVEGKSFSSFEGIPFAKPPLGELRFEEALPVEPWLGVWKATKSYLCPQLSYVGTGSLVGFEDCLYLNIHVPGKEINQNRNLNVHVHIHSGAFQGGSGADMLNSSFMMDHEDIIFVSINYRLGVLGFLSTEDEEVPGNNGLKDQVLALKWIQDNIRYFGGNPDTVTISGFSAGGISVHLHYFSPLSKGLFIRGISHSGTSLMSYAFRKEPLLFTKRLAEGVGCPVNSTKKMKKCLQTKHTAILFEEVKKFDGYGFTPLIPFGPVVEKKSINPFLTEHPYMLLKNKKVLDLPWVVSMASQEGLDTAALVCDQLETINNEFINQGHLMLEFNFTLPTSRRKPFLRNIKDYYLGANQDINEENFYKFVKLLTHGMWLLGIELAAKLQSKATKSPVYFYLYNYENEANRIIDWYCPQKKLKGVSHCDDAVFANGYLVKNEFSENDKKIRKLFYNFFDSFVSRKEPSFDNKVKWLPTEGDELTYLNLTNYNDITVQTVRSLLPDGVWDEVLEAEFEYFNVNTRDEL